jgi:multicomponent Na+:H+ antiporter subunit G
MIDILGTLLIVLGLAFNLFGCLGLVRLPDVYNRLQAATKCVTLGTCSILVGVFLVSNDLGVGLKALLCGGFIVITAPVAAHAISRGSYRGGVKLTPESVIDAYARHVNETGDAVVHDESGTPKSEEVGVNG